MSASLGGVGAFERTAPGVRAGVQAPFDTSSQVRAIASPGAEKPGTAGQQPSGAQVLNTAITQYGAWQGARDAEFIKVR